MSVYGAIANLRKFLYEKAFFKSYSLNAPTVSVGNLTVGGTGKTPLVGYIAEYFSSLEENVCVLTRGYGRENSSERVLVSDGANIIEDVRKTGDEPLELAHMLKEKAVIVADADRLNAGRWALEKFGTSVFVLDDAFQHLRVRRELDLVCIDATNPFGNRKVLPFGILREPIENIKRAGAIIITRANLIDENNLDDLKREVGNLTSAPIFVSRSELEKLMPVKNVETVKPTRYFAFCGLGNPRNFFAQLKDENKEIVGEEAFPDHHLYSQDDMARIEKKARENGADALVTTGKDAVKFKGLIYDLPCFAAKNRLVFDDEKKLRELLRAVLSKRTD